MKSLFSKYGKLISVILAAVVSLMLIVTATYMLTDYEAEISKKAISDAQYNTVVSKSTFYEALEAYKIHTAQIASTISTYNDTSDTVDDYGYTCFDRFKNYLATISATLGDEALIDQIKEVRYYKDGVLHNKNTDLFVGTDISKDHFENHYDEVAYIGDYNDTTIPQTPMIYIGFYSPVYDSPFADAVVVYYTRDQLGKLFDSSLNSNLREFSVLIDLEGKIISGDTKKSDALMGKSVASEANILTILRSLIGVKEPIDNITAGLNRGVDASYSIEIGTEEYILSVGQDNDTIPGLAVVELYKVSVLCESSLAFVNTIISIIVIFTIIAVGLVIYLVVYNVSIKKKLLNIATTDPFLQCNNRNGFEKEAFNILERNAVSYYAVMALEIRHFQFIQETTSEAELNSVLRYIKHTLSKAIQIEETYGYADNGEYLWLIHAKDKNSLIDRLKVFNSVISKNKIANKLDILIKYGIYEIERSEKITVSKMIDYSHEANNTIVKANNENAGMLFNFYDSELRKIRIINEDMELRMESALKNGEFQVFYQPKYNLNLNRQDGAEALVRWYDKETGVYNRPDLFMALFESNGFVVKIDKYVFERVCEYINYSIAHGRQVFPVSVNISRVTAIQPDFVDFYTKIKRKYGIADGQIMIEFTESFAYENYGFLYNIVEQLHQAGFKCSIDDFGCGYSSYRILKSLPMDEIKLDKFFMDRGLSEERDNEIFDSIIRLAKKLKMKVTQEGVEDEAGVALLRRMGCDVIQGYIYAHPMALSDYIKFVQTSREHNLK